MVELRLDRDRKRVKYCPCGDSNNSGKFVPYRGLENYGYCHSCNKTFMPPLNAEIKCFQVFFTELTMYSELAYKLVQGKRRLFIPSSQIFEFAENHCFISEQFLKGLPFNNRPQYADGNDFKIYKGKAPVRIAPAINKITSPVSFIDAHYLKSSLQNYEHNNFTRFLCDKFGSDIARQHVQQYQIGTSSHWYGANVFWQVDADGRIRTGKIMVYHAETGKRVKNPRALINWVHCVLKLPDYNLKQCYFGEHLLKGNSKPVAIVESEKTAIIASIYFPNLIWVASGGCGGLKPDNFKVFTGRNVILYPDLNKYDEWAKLLPDLNKIAKVKISDLLEKSASPHEREKGYDLADYLLQYDYMEFQRSGEMTLKAQFKAEFMKERELPVDEQYPLWLKYNRRGLLVSDAHEVLHDLIDNYGFGVG